MASPMIIVASAVLNGRRERRDVLFEIEAEAIRQAMFSTNGNITRAARKLGIHRQSLQRKLRRL